MMPGGGPLELTARCLFPKYAAPASDDATWLAILLARFPQLAIQNHIPLEDSTLFHTSCLDSSHEMPYGPFNYIGPFFSLLFITSPIDSRWTSVLLFATRVITFLLIFRTYIGPWILARLTSHVRISSISLRSVRGLFFRKGARTLRIDRIRWTYHSSATGLLSIHIEGVRLEISSNRPNEIVRRHGRRLTLSDFSPSPVARHLWMAISRLYSLVAPLFRPFVRVAVVTSLRFIIRHLPSITQSINFHLSTGTLYFADMPGTEISVEEVSLHTKLEFDQLETLNLSYLKEPEPRSLKLSSSLAAWKSRLSGGFKRSLDRAWGSSSGTASMCLKFQNVKGLTRASHKRNSLVTFLRMPGNIDFNTSVGFSPKTGTLGSHSLKTMLSVSDVRVAVDAASSLLDGLMTRKQYSSDFPFNTTRTSIPPTSPTSSSTTASPSALSSPTSSSSPFYSALSSPVWPTRRSIRNTKKPLNSSWMSILLSADIRISAIRLTALSKREDEHPDEAYEAIIRETVVFARLSDPSQDKHYRSWLGRKESPDMLDLEAHSINLSVQGLNLHRTGNAESSHILAVGLVDIQILSSLSPSPQATYKFISGDPEAPLLAMQITVASIEMTESLGILQRLTNRVKAIHETELVHTTPSIPRSIPRIVFELHCGAIRGRIICNRDLPSAESLAVELRSDGFGISAASHFATKLVRLRPLGRDVPSERIPVVMQSTFSMVLRPTFARVRSYGMLKTRYSIIPSAGALDTDFLDDPALLSLEACEITGSGSSLGDINDDEDHMASVDLSTSVFDIRCVSEALAIEMWHPSVIGVVLDLAKLVPNNSQKAKSSAPVLDRLPSGLSVTVAIPRIVIFITSPDINPNDEMDLSRGAALRTGISICYSSMQTRHTHPFRSLSTQSQTRHKLYLTEDPIVEAVAAAKASSATQLASAFIKVAAVGLTLRSAAATQYVADDPYMVERDDPAFKDREFLSIPRITTDITISGKRGSAPSGIDDVCAVSVHIPYVRATFKLAYVYSVFLATRTLTALSKAHHRSTEQSPASLSLRFQGKVKTVQVLWFLPKQKISSRVENFTFHSAVEAPHAISWNKIFAWVPVAHRSKSENKSESRWEELLCLREWHVSLPRVTHGSGFISVEGDSGRLRIPFGYVLADLIQDMSVTFKAARHILYMISNGHYMDMPSPEAEGAKSLPTITFRIRCLWAEIADDPFENRLALIWRAGLEAAKNRLEREEAFVVKVAAIAATEKSEAFVGPFSAVLPSDYNFTANHSVSIGDARQRLDQVHSVDWILRHRLLQDKKVNYEERILQKLRRASPERETGSNIPNLVQVHSPDPAAPLLRIMLENLTLRLAKPSFPSGLLADYMFEQGGGLPKDSQFTLLIPIHINLTLSALKVNLRDYPLPLIHIPPSATKEVAFEFDTDLVIAEEMGTKLSVDWVPCNVVEPRQGAADAPLTIHVPKTIMPVKTYANPAIRVTSPGVTAFAWGVSYGPATQDLMRVVDTLTSSPRDSSPAIGFWDKMRLVFHWTFQVSFKGDVRLYMKGSRDPYHTYGDGAGFALTWQGNPRLLVGKENNDKELIQVVSDSMSIAIPNLSDTEESTNSYKMHTRQEYQKICAKFSSGVRFGIGFALERSCSQDCDKGHAQLTERRCRLFDFRPHYEVKLEKKESVPLGKGPYDSYNGFRSDYIHLSISLTSNIRPPVQNPHSGSSSLHLSPKVFTHFWSWWELFDSVLSLPIRHGTYYPSKTISPKLGRHLATIKYRILVPRLFIMHAYIDESRETWADGVTPFVGIKAMINEFQADMHQREQETIVPGILPNTTKVIRHKPFYAAEVVLKELDLRSLLAIFTEPRKQDVPLTAPPERSNYRTRNDLDPTDITSAWIDKDDFIETDWLSAADPVIYLLPLVSCPRFTYFKRNSTTPGIHAESSRFGDEDSHTCLLGKESSVSQIQIALALERIIELRHTLQSLGPEQQQTADPSSPRIEKTINDTHQTVEKMLVLLENYITLLQDTDAASNATNYNNVQSYYMPSDTVSPEEWAEFSNVFQVHCPKIFMDSAIRDNLMQYYYCSRARRGLEYHMAARAVKFIRDQANAALDSDTREKGRGAANAAQVAALALRKVFAGDSPKPSIEISESVPSLSPGVVDPLNGWSDGVSLQKSNFCLLLKPQIILRSEDCVCVLAAVQAKLQSFEVMDDANLDDPISGKVMTRTYTSLTGLQSFAPTNPSQDEDGCVPLEVLIDFRCESSRFDRLVPQTDATFQYDKFNRLRLRNGITSVARVTMDQCDLGNNNHLQNQTDLVQVNIPRFTVTASDEHFQSISSIVTQLILFSDAAQKTRLDRLDTLLFTYDFTDLSSVADVVSDFQGRLRSAIEMKRTAEHQTEDVDELDLLKLNAHIYLLAEELNLLFDAIKLAQDRFDDHTDQKSALLLHASSSEISWRMLDEKKDLLAKLAVRDINYYWLSRQDGSTVNNLAVGDLQAFDGYPHALWTEILCKYDEPPNHPLLKRGLFVLANWTVLAPVGGITIYEEFELSLHPMRLQVDARVGRRILEYMWPARRQRGKEIEDEGKEVESSTQIEGTRAKAARSSLDSPRTLHSFRRPTTPALAPPPTLRKLGSSRSFTDLRASASESLHPPKLHKARSSTLLRPLTPPPRHSSDGQSSSRSFSDTRRSNRDRKLGDAAEMKTRSSQKSFVYVKISSLNILLSIMKEQSFECRDAKIRTRDLEYRNQTSSFEELVNQFIPSDMSWRGWVKMAFHQPLVPVLPVARELISKTKWIANKSGDAPKLLRAKGHGSESSSAVQLQLPRPSRLRRSSRSRTRAATGSAGSVTGAPLTTDPEPIDSDGVEINPPRRKRMLSLFSQRRKNTSSNSIEAQDKTSTEDDR